MLVTLNEVLRRRLGHKRFSALYPHFIQQHIVPGAITRSEQLPYARVMAFSRNSLFLERFWREFLSFKKNAISCQTWEQHEILFAHLNRL